MLFIISPNKELRSLTQLAENETGTVDSIGKSEISNKLLEMGILPGSTIRIRNKAPFGGPVSIEVCGYCLSIRKNDADLILISE